jgi:hypothetical protein
MLTVKELMKFLSHADPDAEVRIGDSMYSTTIERLYSSLNMTKFYIEPAKYSDPFGR